MQPLNIRYIVAIGCALVFFAPMTFANLVRNGDFSLGNFGFQTDYQYVFHDGYCEAEGVYTVGDRPQHCNHQWANFLDHTGAFLGT